MKRWLTTVLPGRYLGLAAVLLAAFTTIAAQAQESPPQTPPPPPPLPATPQASESDGLGFHGFLILGGVVVPDYKGSRDYTPSPFAAARLSYDTYYIDLKGPTAEINVSPFTGFEFGPSIGWAPGRNDVSNNRVNDMRQIDSTIVGGAFLKISTKQFLQPTDELAFKTDVLTDLGGKQQGTTISFGPSYSFSPIEKFRLGVDLSATYGSGDYTNTYFGVSASDARRSGLSQFHANGGINDVGVTLTATYQWNEHWGVTGLVGYTRLVGDAADSPIVDDKGSANQLFAGTGIVFKF